MEGDEMGALRGLLMGAGVVIVLGTLAAWYWIAAFGCGMATAGRRNFSMPCRGRSRNCLGWWGRVWCWARGCGAWQNRW
jgi:hypothetical protein